MHSTIKQLPDCTGILQSLDARIINIFKTHYQKYIWDIIDQITNDDFSAFMLPFTHAW